MKSNLELELAQAGRTRYSVIVSATAIAAERTAAQTLAEFLTQVTGAAFCVVTEAGVPAEAPALYVGWTAFAAGHGLAGESLPPEAWRITCVGPNVILTGGRTRGTWYAVTEFLENCIGVHLLCPWTTVVPSVPDLVIPAPEASGQPVFIERIMAETSVPDFRCPANQARRRRFFAFNKADLPSALEYGIIPVASGCDESDPLPPSTKRGSGGWVHSLGMYVPAAEYGSAHPEYFALHRKPDGTLFRNTDDRGTISSSAGATTTASRITPARSRIRSTAPSARSSQAGQPYPPR